MTINCPNCSYDCPPDFAFCPKCGSALHQTCPQCQNQSPLDFAFCPKCGSKFGSEPAPPPPAPPPPPVDPLAERLKRLVPKGYADKLLSSQDKVESERRIVTILFSDIKGSTAMSETMDPEDVMEIMDDAFDVLIEPIYRHEGTLARLMGDAVLAFFGAPVAHEDDPIRACRAALDIVNGAKDFAARLERERGISGFNVRVGINTGLVVVGEIGSDLRVEYTAMGDAINLASRMEQAAPVGGVLISSNTYGYIEDMFDCQSLEPITVKGKAKPVQVYLVEREKPRTFQAPGRGIQGITVPLIGRETELSFLQDSYLSTAEQVQSQVLTLVAEAGVGKSRLLREFDIWLNQQPQQPERFVGRAETYMQHLPFALLRDIFTFRSQIQTNDSPTLKRQKLVSCVEAVIGPQAQEQAAVEIKAHFIGQLLGFDFSDSPHLKNLVADARQIYDRTLVYLGEFFKAAAANTPIVILLEDIHWADDSSLDILNQLALALTEQRLLIICTTRPIIYERRPNWGSGRPFFKDLRLHRLSPQDSRRLVREILSGVDVIPEHLIDLITRGAEGNPFYIEELIKMLIEDGVIVQEEGHWQVALKHLAEIRVPPTLTGVVQARLDALPKLERETLQRASVIGRLFWDEAINSLLPANKPLNDRINETQQHLTDLQSREIVYEQAESDLAGTQAYRFKNIILRDVTYEGILKRLRRRYHSQIADWLRQRSDQQSEEHAGQIGDHLELAGKTAEAAHYLRQAGEQAARQYANTEAISYFSRALALTPEDDLESHYALRLDREKVYDIRGEREAQAQDLAALAKLATQLGHSQRQAEVILRQANFADVTGDHPATIAAAQKAVDLGQSTNDAYSQAVGHWFWGRALWRQGDYESAQSHLEQSLALALQNNDMRVQADSLRNLGGLAYHQSQYPKAVDYYKDALDIYLAIKDQQGESAILQNLGIVARNQGDYSTAKQYYEGALQLSQIIGNRLDESDALTNMGVATMYQSDYNNARKYFEQSRKIKQEIDDRDGEGMVLGNLGIIARNQGDLTAALKYFKQAADRYNEFGYQHPESLALANLGLLYHYIGDNEKAKNMCFQAVQISRAIGARHVEAEALTYLGHVQLSLGHEGEAFVNYQKALKIRQDLEQPNMATEPIAGLAAVELVRHQPDKALRNVEKIMAYLAENSLDGTDEPFRVYLTCYRVFQAVEDGRSTEILATAYQDLQEQAAKISSETMREAFLNDITIHREIIEAWSQSK